MYPPTSVPGPRRNPRVLPVNDSHSCTPSTNLASIMSLIGMCSSHPICAFALTYSMRQPPFPQNSEEAAGQGGRSDRSLVSPCSSRPTRPKYYYRPVPRTLYLVGNAQHSLSSVTLSRLCRLASSVNQFVTTSIPRAHHLALHPSLNYGPIST